MIHWFWLIQAPGSVLSCHLWQVSLQLESPVSGNMLQLSHKMVCKTMGVGVDADTTQP